MGVVAIVFAAAPPMSSWLEAEPSRHLLIQYPALIAGGAILSGVVDTKPRAGGRWAPAALLAALFAAGFWLVPRWIDAAIASPLVDSIKKIALVALAGVPLGYGWRRAGLILKGVFWANIVAMLVVMAWVQLAIPVRLCNAYLLADQHALGRNMFALALFLLLYGAISAIAGGRSTESATPGV